jgi:hypothetical protein
MWKSYVLMEMAPLEMMPHTINLFLRQVHRGLWDGTYMTLNDEHVMQFGPRPDDESGANFFDGDSTLGNFHHMGLDRVSYQEYSPDYPHETYTIGMAGRPSGPDIYINRSNNTMAHGPGGQMNDGGEMHKEADPCFGRLVDGNRPFKEILELMDLVPIASVDRYPEAKIRIKSANILLQGEGGRWYILGRGQKWNEKDKVMPLPKK